MQTTARLRYTIIILLLLTSTAQAQYYEQAVGLRLGYSSGVSYKVFFEEDRGVELTLTGRDRSILAGGLLVHHTSLTEGSTGQLFLYYGGGLHLGLTQEDFFFSGPPDPPNPVISVERRTYFVMGADGIGGVEYRFLGAPVAISWDIKPFVEQVGFRNIRFRFWDTSLTLRYTFR